MKKNTTKRKTFKYIFFRTVVILYAINAFLHIVVDIYTRDYYGAHESAYECINNPPDHIEVIFNKDRLIFMPENPTAGIIFYPGALVEYTAYAPLMEQLAENGIAMIDLRMSHNMAVLSPNAADGVIEEYPQITKWYMAGHSLGGAIASQYADKHESDYEGLILLASFSPNKFDEDMKILSIRGSNDGVLNIKRYTTEMVKNADITTEIVIFGGIHSYFGAYGPQQDDGVASITYEQQQEQTIDAIMEFIK